MNESNKPKATIKPHLKGINLPESYIVYKKYEPPREKVKKKINIIPYNGEAREHRWN